MTRLETHRWSSDTIWPDEVPRDPARWEQSRSISRSSVARVRQYNAPALKCCDFYIHWKI
jgi:hypothetical protein